MIFCSGKHLSSLKFICAVQSYHCALPIESEGYTWMVYLWPSSYKFKCISHFMFEKYQILAGQVRRRFQFWKGIACTALQAWLRIKLCQVLWVWGVVNCRWSLREKLKINCLESLVSVVSTKVMEYIRIC